MTHKPASSRHATPKFWGDSRCFIPALNSGWLRPSRYRSSEPSRSPPAAACHDEAGSAVRHEVHQVLPRSITLCRAQLVDKSLGGLSSIALGNHPFRWINQASMAIFNSYVYQGPSFLLTKETVGKGESEGWILITMLRLLRCMQSNSLPSIP